MDNKIKTKWCVKTLYYNNKLRKIKKLISWDRPARFSVRFKGIYSCLNHANLYIM